MRVCPQCACAYRSEDWTCPSCGYRPEEIGSYPAFAPDLAYQNAHFSSIHYKPVFSLEDRNFWYRARNRLIVWAVRRFFPQAASFLEVGCGAGYVLSGIRRALPALELTGGELFIEGLRYASTRLPRHVRLLQMDARKIPYREEFDVAGSFDVLEHIPEDEEVLRQMFQAVRPGGGVVISVPQHAFLWSRFDEGACHVRRYSTSELQVKLERAGFQVVFSTSFVSLLFPLMLASRWLSRWRKDCDHYSELKIGGFLNSALEFVLGCELALIRLGVRMPMGGSRLAVARRPG